MTAKAITPRRLLSTSAALVILVMFINPFASAQTTNLRKDERVIVFPGMAWRDGQNWYWDLRAWVYEPEKRAFTVGAMQKLLGLAMPDLTPEEEAIFKERARWFLVDNERGKKLKLYVNRREYLLPSTAENGHIAQHITITGADGELWTGAAHGRDQRVLCEVMRTPDEPKEPGNFIQMMQPTGISVISDIDDTIKISQITDHKELLANTFLRPFRPVNGMSDLYKYWAKERGAQFHYVSASPWQLYPALETFCRDKGFPFGTFHLKEFRLKDSSAANLFDSPVDYKLRIIEPLMRRFPQRKFVLVGDSGEKDPEIYGEVARKYKDQILAIFIRDVTDEPRTAERYKEAFRDVDPDLWRVFTDPKTLQGSLP